MHQSNSSRAVELPPAPNGETLFPPPDGCLVESCSAIAMYEREMVRHRATVAALRESLVREIDLLRQKDELLAQSEVLAKEAEHRLLNGLQMIRSVLAMQSRSTGSQEAATQLNMAAQRISTLSRVHEHLHAIDALESVEFRRYLESLCCDLSILIPDDAHRSLRVEGVEMMIPRNVATPLAFIASEIIINSIKYAKGTIRVNLERLSTGDASLSVSDDGPGLPRAFDPAASKGLGMQIIAAFARQIQGTLIFGKGDHDTGARVSVRFRT